MLTPRLCPTISSPSSWTLTSTPRGTFQTAPRKREDERLTVCALNKVCMLTASSTANNRVLIYRKYGLEHIICLEKSTRLEKTKLKESDKSMCLDLTLAVHRWVHAEVKGKKEDITILNKNYQLCIATSSGHERHKGKLYSWKLYRNKLFSVKCLSSFFPLCIFLTPDMYSYMYSCVRFVLIKFQ